jgi:septum formation inhibitor MinC
MFTKTNLLTFKNISLLSSKNNNNNNNNNNSERFTTPTTTTPDSDSSHTGSGGGGIYTVNLTKEEQNGFGFLIKQNEKIPFFSIWEIIENGPAEQNGKIKKGDIILKVNDSDLTGYDYEKGLELLRSIKVGTNVTFTLSHTNSNCTSDNNSETSSSYQSEQQQHQKSIEKKRLSFLSPMKMLRKKFFNCTTNNTNSPMQTNILNTNELTSPAQNQMINNNNNNNNNNDTKDKIKITQNGDEICINIGNSIEICTSRTNDRKIISLSPNLNRKNKYFEQNLEHLNLEDLNLTGKLYIIFSVFCFFFY